LVAFSVLAFYGPLLLYAIRQGVGQLNIVWNAEPVSHYLNAPDFPDSLKQRLHLINEVRRFAIDSLALKDTENYTTVFDQKGEEIMWVVTACEPFQLRPVTWSFPVVGTVPYKGYFDKNKALAEREELIKKGLDVSIRNPGGWSTLGWFTDPILSGMLNRSEGDLASLIIHEMVHATLWVKDSVNFNENLASFIGDTAAYQFLGWRYGLDSKEYKTYLYEDQDYRLYSAYVLRASKRLDSLYQTMKDEEPADIKKERKEKLIRSIVVNMDTLQLKLTHKPSLRFSKRLPNNTYFMAYRYYQSRQNIFERELDSLFRGDLKAYVTFLSKKYPSD
jgi:predicted aminopeptidase